MNTVNNTRQLSRKLIIMIVCIAVAGLLVVGAATLGDSPDANFLMRFFYEASLGTVACYWVIFAAILWKMAMLFTKVIGDANKHASEIFEQELNPRS